VPDHSQPPKARPPHLLVAQRARGIAHILETEWLLAVETARQAPHRPRLDATDPDRGGVRSVGTHSDPTSAAAVGHLASIESHPLANRPAELRQALQALDDALVHLEHKIEHTLEFDRRTIERLDRAQAEAELRAARPIHRYCWACEAPIDTGGICEADRKLRGRMDPAEYVAHHGDQSAAALDAAFARKVRERVAQGTLVRPGSPHAVIGQKVIVHEHEVDQQTGAA
jgi:hypothetical protein